MWYNPAITLSHNCMLNYVISNRGGGKTFSTLLYCIKKYFENGSQFIYLRRTDVEVKECKATMFDAIMKEEMLPDYTFECKGRETIAMDGKGKKYRMGFVTSLSKAYQLKSVPYPNVKYIIFDEFLLEDGNGNYLTNEVNMLLAFIETVGRMRDIVVICLGNYTSNSNPYFDYFKIYPKIGGVFFKDRRRGVLIHHFHDEEYADAKKDTPFGRLVSNTDYGAYMIDNVALLDDESYIKSPKNKTSVRYILSNGDDNYKVEIDTSNDEMYIRNCKSTNVKLTYAMDVKEHPEFNTTIQANKSHPVFKQIAMAISYNKCYFETRSIRDVILSHLKMI